MPGLKSITSNSKFLVFVRKKLKFKLYSGANLTSTKFVRSGNEEQICVVF